MQVDLSAIDGAIAFDGGLPRLRAPVVAAWLDTHVRLTDRDDAMRSVVHGWLERMGEAMGSLYRVLATESVVLLSAQPERHAALLLASATSSFQRVAQFVGPKTALDWVPMLAFSDVERYYDYLAPLYPDEGHYAGAAGACIYDDFVHVVLAPAELLDLEAVSAHELAHAHASGLTLPTWLDEGLAEVATEPFGKQLPSVERLAEARSCWRQHGLDGFWTGEVFGLPDDRGMFAYELAYLLVKSLLMKDTAAFAALLRDADEQDSGEAACRAHFDLDVHQLARSMLGA